MKATLERILEKINTCDLLLIEIKPDWYLELKVPVNIICFRTIDDLFTPIHKVDADKDIQLALNDNDFHKGQVNKICVYCLGQYNYEEFEAYLTMLKLDFSTEDYITFHIESNPYMIENFHTSRILLPHNSFIQYL